MDTSIKEINPMKIKDMDIQVHNKEKMKKKDGQKKPSTPLNYSEKRDFDPRPESKRIVSEERKQGCLTKVREVLPKAVINISFALPECYDAPPSLHDIASTVHSKLPSGAQILELEKVTRDQSSSNC